MDVSNDKTIAMPGADPPPGSGLIFGRFVTEGIIGRGGMGIVYRATDPVIGRQVAIKALRVDRAFGDEQHREMTSRFELEFKLAGSLSHPNVVTIYDVGTTNDITFIAMELVEGDSLEAQLRRGDTLTYEDVCRVADHLCAGLDYAHSHGVVHRDIKPANLLITKDGIAKITDFGVAKARSTDLTQTGTVIGTPSYMSPEQIRGTKLSGASDQFSAAIILYQMLTGRLPYASDEPATVLYRIVHSEPKPPTEINAELPPAVDEVLLMALSKEPEERFPSCRKLAQAIRRALDQGDREAIAGTHTVTLSHTPILAGTGTYASAHKSSGTKWFLALAAVVVLAFGTWFAFDDLGGFLPGTGAVSADGGAGDSADPTAAGTPVATDASPNTAGNGTTGSGTTGSDAPMVPVLQTFVVTSKPEGASISVDGESITGATPVELELALTESHRIGVAKEGFEGQSILLEPDDPRRELHFELPPLIPPGRLVVEASYSVDVRVNGRSVNLDKLEPGSYRVQLRNREVFLDQEQTVEIRPDETTSIALPALAEIRLISVAPNGTVRIDGGDALEPPLSVQLLRGSEHRIRFQWPDGSVRESEIKARPRLQVIGSPEAIETRSG